jgi:hypothetical protein
MERSTFERHFRKAHTHCLEWTRTWVIQPLPDQRIFQFFPYDSDEFYNPEYEVIYPEEALPDPLNDYLEMTEEEVIRYLWRDGKVPAWVNVSVRAQDRRYTYIALECCGRYTDHEDFIYHHWGGCPPFQVQSPPMPIGWKGVEEDGKFDLYWDRRLWSRIRTLWYRTVGKLRSRNIRA